MPQPILQDHDIAMLAPSALAPGVTPSAGDEDARVRDAFERIYRPQRNRGTNAYDLSRLATALYHYRPLLSRVLPTTQDKYVLEIGAATGVKALAWADLFAEYVGVEVQTHQAATANETFHALRVRNARVIAGNAELLLKSPEQFGLPRIDLLVLYAVLEHLTIDEQRSILSFAEEIYQEGGMVLIAESPNRLLPFDAHSFQLHFIEWLPIELLTMYMARSRRTDLPKGIDEMSGEAGREALHRFGLSISFHEFECFWQEKTMEQLGAVGDGYTRELLNLTPFSRSEWDLYCYCRDNEIRAHRMFTRFWIEALLSRHVGRARPQVRYLNPRELTDAPVTERRRFWELDEVTIGVNSAPSLQIDADAHTNGETMLLLDISRSSGTLVIADLALRTERAIDLQWLSLARLPTWHHQVTLSLGPAAHRYRVSLAERNASSRLTTHGVLLA